MNINESIHLRETFIYIITNNKNKKRYIGITSNLDQRKLTHFSRLRSNNHANDKLQSDFNFYGEDAFTFEVIKSIKNRTQALNEERSLIKKYNSIIDGYNIKGNDSVWHKKITLGAQVSEPLGKTILNYIDKEGISISEWVRSAINKKAKEDGLL